MVVAIHDDFAVFDGLVEEGTGFSCFETSAGHTLEFINKILIVELISPLSPE